MPDRSHPLSMAELTERVEAGQVDTVPVVFTDMQGRLQEGKRVHARYFLTRWPATGWRAATTSSPSTSR